MPPRGAHWLEQHHAHSPGVWLVLHKKGGTVTELDYEAALEEALCFGWIDGQGRRRDEESSFQRMTPPGPEERLVRPERGADRAGWKADRKDGRRRAGRRRRRQSGRALGSRLFGAATAEVPDDLAAAIAAEPRAQAMFDVLTSVNRYALIYRTNSVKQASTRERKIAGFVEMLARLETPYPQKRRPAGQTGA